MLSDISYNDFVYIKLFEIIRSDKMEIFALTVRNTPVPPVLSDIANVNTDDDIVCTFYNRLILLTLKKPEIYLEFRQF